MANTDGTGGFVPVRRIRMRPATPPPEAAPAPARAPRAVRRVNLGRYQWVDPAPTHWPHDVLPDPPERPPGPRARRIGYNPVLRKMRAEFRDGTKWTYDDVAPEQWEALQQLGSTGKYIIRVLDTEGGHGGPKGRGSRGWH